MLDSWEFHIVPILNPDGYAYSHSRVSYEEPNTLKDKERTCEFSFKDRMWRKNRKPVGNNCFGVDLNRNFGYQWNTGGSSPIPCSDTFHGGTPMSENEAKALQKYMTGKAWTTYLTFHSYGQ